MALSKNQLEAIDTLLKPENVKLSWDKKAELLGVTTKTLYNWRQSQDFTSALQDGYKRELLSHRGSIDQVLINACLKGDLKAIRTYYEITGAVFEAKDKQVPFQAIQINIHQHDTKPTETAQTVKVEYIE